METATLIYIFIAVAIAFAFIIPLAWLAIRKIGKNIAADIKTSQQKELAKIKSELTTELPAMVLEKLSSDDKMRQKIAKDVLLEIGTNSDDLESLRDMLTDGSVIPQLRDAVSARSPQNEIAQGVKALNKKLSDFMHIFEKKESHPDAQEPTIGIITALPNEYVAVEALLENLREDSKPGRGAGRKYFLGEVPLKDGGRHYVALALLTEMGNNSAAVRAAHLLAHFPRVESIIMVGIAGGIPFPEKPDEHVRLGDIVVSDRYGVIQYNNIKEEQTQTIHRHPPRPPSATLLEAVRYLDTLELKGQSPWWKFIRQACEALKVSRPPDKADILVSSAEPMKQIEHPKDPKRKRRQPRVFKGPIASADTLLKNPIKRDELRDKFGVKAVEMEGSGIADATWQNETGYLVVRGICDYCDSKKGDNWQRYAAIVAAAYTRALLESIPSHILVDD